jgi:hypothetical protein
MPPEKTRKCFWHFEMFRLRVPPPVQPPFVIKAADKHRK